jgi:hypothetical protein
MAEKFTSNNAPTPHDWKGPSKKGSVMRKLDGRLSVNKAEGEDASQDQRRNALDL